jgi:hypothetical protein
MLLDNTQKVSLRFIKIKEEKKETGQSVVVFHFVTKKTNVGKYFYNPKKIFCSLRFLMTDCF